MINIEANHLARLIDNVLCYARIHDSASTYDMELLDVGDLVHEAAERLHPRLESQGIQADVRVPAAPVMIRGDALMLSHVFDNVIENSITHAGNGRWLGATVTAGVNAVVIDIDDKGGGIPAEERARVFEKFYRRKGTRQRGTGLGLAIVRRIIEDHGGHVEVLAAEEAGTRVRIVLPPVTS
jgi:signal transduction histidine kinase